MARADARTSVGDARCDVGAVLRSFELDLADRIVGAVACLPESRAARDDAEHTPPGRDELARGFVDSGCGMRDGDLGYRRGRLESADGTARDGRLRVSLAGEHDGDRHVERELGTGDPRERTRRRA